MANLNLNVNTNNTSITSDVVIDDKTKFVNLTPHEVVLQKLDGSFESIPSSGVARISTYFKVERIVRGILVGETVTGEITGLPDPAEDTLYIVSALLVKELPERTDLVAPFDQVRNEKGLVQYGKALTA